MKVNLTIRMVSSSNKTHFHPFLLILILTTIFHANHADGVCENITSSHWPVDCSLRALLITPNSQNQTVLMLTTTIYDTVYNTISANTAVWTFARRMGFNSYWNSIRNIIWSTTTYSTMESKLNNIVVMLNAYSSNNCTLQADLFKAQLHTPEGGGTWGSVGDFVKCGNVMEPTTTTLSSTIKITTTTKTNACNTTGHACFSDNECCAGQICLTAFHTCGHCITGVICYRNIECCSGMCSHGILPSCSPIT